MIMKIIAMPLGMYQKKSDGSIRFAGYINNGFGMGMVLDNDVVFATIHGTKCQSRTKLVAIHGTKCQPRTGLIALQCTKCQSRTKLVTICGTKF